MITTNDAKKGTLVSFTDMYHSRYKQLSQWFGVILEHRVPDIVTVQWYEDEECTLLRDVRDFSFKRLSLRDEPSIVPRTKLERKCRKLWNQSNWVKSNPSRAY